MSIALVIPTADFSDNAMEQIIVTEPVPCTGITLDKATGEITVIGGSLTLIPTVTPSDTTDSVIWESSDTTVATASNGVVTTVGVGTATITARCGNYSASCTITSRAFMSDATIINNAFLSGNGALSGGNGLPTIAENALRGALLSASGTLGFNSTYKGAKYYPYVLPQGTKRIKVTRTTPANIRFEWILLFNANTASASQSSVCELINKVSKMSNVDAELIYDLPVYEGFGEIDAVAINLKTMNESTGWQESDFDSVTIEFLPSE